MTYLELGKGEPVLFVHGNPTSSYLWRNVMPHVGDGHRAIAIDLIGMGGSAKPDIAYSFDDHYRYFAALPALLFVESMALALKAIAPSVKSEPRIGGSLFRIHRDTRFSADKSPYKAHVGLRFRDADTASSSKCTGPLFYVEFDATRLRLGVGVKEFGSDTLQSYRRAVARKEAADEISGIIRRAHRGGHTVLGDVLARVPPGYSSRADDDLLRRKGLFIVQETGLPNEIYRPDFVAFCMRSFEPQAPLFDRLRRIALAGTQ